MIILCDKREKEPFNFSFFNEVSEYKLTTLKTGDYTIQDYQDILFIERKKNTGELYINLGLKWKTFQKELDRMKIIPYRYLICEFLETDFNTFPYNSGIPNNKWSFLKMNKTFLKSRFYEVIDKYKLTPIFSSNKQEAEQKTLEIFKYIKDLHE